MSEDAIVQANEAEQQHGDEEDSLKQVFDLVVIGTDTANAIIAAAAARVGKKVLHLDANSFYGGASATIGLSGFHQHLIGDDRVRPAVAAAECGFNLEYRSLQGVEIVEFEPTPIPEPDATNTLSEDPNAAPPAASGESQPEEPAAAGAGAAAAQPAAQPAVEAFETLCKLSRQYNVDLAPKLCLSDGAMIKLLVSSGVHKYTEFKCLESTLIAKNDGLHAVPCSKGEIFQSKIISPLEKRVLMRFMQAAAEDTLSKEGSFLDLLKSNGLSEPLQRFVLHAIVFSATHDKISADDGVSRLQAYIRSTGKFGEGAHLWTYYGVSEISQAFCRLSAVYGGVYLLRCDGPMSISPIPTPNPAADDALLEIVADNKSFRTKHAVIASYLAPLAAQPIAQHRADMVARCVVITSTSIVADKGIALGVLPPDTCGNQQAVFVQQVDFSAQACPRGKYLWMVWTRCSDAERDADADGLARRKLQPALDWIGEKIRAREEVVMHWCAFYLQGSACDVQVAGGAAAAGGGGGDIDHRVVAAPEHVTVVPCTSAAVEIDEAVHVARAVFGSLYDGEEFLPTMPDPEDAEVQEELAEAHEELQRRQQNESNNNNGAGDQTDAAAEPTELAEQAAEQNE